MCEEGVVRRWWWRVQERPRGQRGQAGTRQGQDTQRQSQEGGSEWTLVLSLLLHDTVCFMQPVHIFAVAVCFTKSITQTAGKLKYTTGTA